MRDLAHPDPRGSASAARADERDVMLIGYSDAQLLAECGRRGLLPRPTEAIDGAALRAARGLLDWSLADLAAASGVSTSTIKRIEDGGPGRPQARKLAALRRTLDGVGLRFTDTAGAIGLQRVAPSRTN